MDWFEILAPEASGEAVFLGVKLKWISAYKMNKMITRGKLSIHLQEAPNLSKEWGEGQTRAKYPAEMLAEISPLSGSKNGGQVPNMVLIPLTKDGR